MSIFLIIFILLLFLYYQYVIKAWPKNFPSGLPRLPLGGHYFLLRLMNYETVHEPIIQICKWFKSNLVGFFFFDYALIAASDQESIREVLFRPEFQGRLDIFPARLKGLGMKRGLFSNDGPAWLEQRRFTLRNLRNFGFGCRNANEEALLSKEAQEMVDILNSYKGKKGITLPNIFWPHALNNFWSMAAGVRFQPEEHNNFSQLFQGLNDNVNTLDVSGNLITYWPWIRFILPNVTKFKSLLNGQNILRDFVKEELKRHKEKHIPGIHNDFIDYYLDKLKEDTDIGKNTTFSDDELVVILMDMLIASVQAVPNVLTFLIICLLKYPENQLKAQAQIDDVVGRGRLPNLDDRKNLPFVDALLREVMRFISLTPLGVMRLATEDATIQGCDIKKGTVLAANLQAMHMDPNLWDNPNDFCPERMLDQDGFINLKADKSLPFGQGKRVCVGETFSRQTMFVIASALLQNFTLWPLDPIPDHKNFKTGQITYVEPFKVKAIPRI